MLDDRVSYINLGCLGFKQFKDLKSIHRFSPQKPNLFSSYLEMIILVGYQDVENRHLKNNTFLKDIVI